MEKICIVGLGYIGLPTASFLATKGYEVHGVDVRPDIVSALNEGRTLIFEPGLDIMVKSAVNSGRLKAHMEPTEADIFILSLPTPFMEGKKPDLSYVRQGVAEIAPYLAPGNMVILESTSPVGTTEKICQWLHESRPDLVFPGQPGGSGQIHVAHCPERVLPGRILQELVHNDRIVGGCDAASTEKAAAFYSSFVQGNVYSTNSRTAEFVKLAENSYRDVNIAFANELSLICDEIGVDVWEGIRLANRHPRVNILSPGAGVGGHCISVDPWFLAAAAPDVSRLIRTARETNDHKADWVYERAAASAARFSSPVIACMGLAFKPDVDDLRESPAVHIAARLASYETWHILAVEPYIHELPEKLRKFDNVEMAGWKEALAKADVIIFLVGHKPFRAISSRDLLDKVVLDACGLFQPAVRDSQANSQNNGCQGQ